MDIEATLRQSTPSTPKPVPMEILKIVVHTIEYILYTYLLVNALYYLVFAFASLFSIPKKKRKTSQLQKFAILIPAYKEDAVIVQAVKEAIKQTYPSALYDIVVIADSLSEKTLQHLEKLPIRIIRVYFTKNRTKVKALYQAMLQLGDDYQIALVLDADNIVAPDFLEKMNQTLNKGFMVAQGHRIAKNLNTPIAILDAISEEINNKLFRKGHNVLGLPSGLIGSGMAFEYTLFKNLMQEARAIGGFDKELELKLTRKKYPIAYVEDAYVYDEKVDKKETFQKQRTRWMAAQFVYLRKFYKPAIYELFTKGNFFFFDKLFQMAFLPRILLAGITALLTLGNGILFVIFPHFYTRVFACSFWSWLALLLIIKLMFLLATPTKFYTRKTLMAMLQLPKVFLIMFSLLFKLKGADKKFIHTPHGIKKPVNNTQ
jgi:cellulose synthase/poly-beta-1,6-N-acetylglucosamine synthase-like glycosyltransferase